MKFSYINKKFFYIFMLILTISINLLSMVAGKYMGMNLSFSKILIFWLSVLMMTYGLKFTLWFILHSKFQLSFMYPILSLNYFFSLFLGSVLFQEAITVSKMVGSVVMVFGVFIMTMSSKKLEGVWYMLYISLAVLIQFLVALAQVIFKIGATKVNFKKPLVYNLKNKYLLMSMFLFLLVPLLSVITMSVIDFSDFYSFTALSYFFIMLFSWKILKEDIDSLSVMGNFLVIAGVMVFNL